MSQSVLCPQCGKKFGLPDRPPATYTCTGCGTLMDLSAFRAPTPPAAPTTRRSPPPRRAPPPGASPRPPRRPRRDGSLVLLIFVGVFILILVIIVLARGGGDAPPRASEDEHVATAPPPATEDLAPPPPRHRPPPPPPMPHGTHRGRDGKPRLDRIVVAEQPWPDSVDAATRTRVEALIPKLYEGGRDGVEARDALIRAGRPICGRLISEFRLIQREQGFDNREGASRAAVIDGLLRSIDGQVERFWKHTERVRAWGIYAAPSFIKRVAGYWNWWWSSGEWSKTPRAPWVPQEDGTDTPRAGAPAAKPPQRHQGWRKPAGSD